MELVKQERERARTFGSVTLGQAGLEEAINLVKVFMNDQDLKTIPDRAIISPHLRQAGARLKSSRH